MAGGTSRCRARAAPPRRPPSRHRRVAGRVEQQAEVVVRGRARGRARFQGVLEEGARAGVEADRRLERGLGLVERAIRGLLRRPPRASSGRSASAFFAAAPWRAARGRATGAPRRPASERDRAPELLLGAVAPRAHFGADDEPRARGRGQRVDRPRILGPDARLDVAVVELDRERERAVFPLVARLRRPGTSRPRASAWRTAPTLACGAPPRARAAPRTGRRGAQTAPGRVGSPRRTPCARPRNGPTPPPRRARARPRPASSARGSACCARARRSRPPRWPLRTPSPPPRTGPF